MSTTILADLTRFNDALVNGERVDCNQRGEWYVEGKPRRFIRWIRGTQDDRINRVAEAFNRTLDQIEQTRWVRVEGHTEQTFEQDQAFYKKVLVVQKNLKNVLQEAKDNPKIQNFAQRILNGVISKIERYLLGWFFKPTKATSTAQSLIDLGLRVTSLRYRIGGTLGKKIGLKPKDKKASLTLNCKWLKTEAKKWKKEYPLYRNKELTPAEVVQLEVLAKYPKFVKLLVDEENKTLRQEFFKITLRDNYPAEVAIKYLSTTLKLKQAFVTARIGRFIGDPSSDEFPKIELIGVDEEGVQHVYLPFEEEGEVRLVSILNPDAEAPGMGGRTVAEVLKVFADKNNAPGDLEFFGRSKTTGGEWIAPRIRPWHTHHHSDIGEENYEGDDWFEQIPVLETLNADDLFIRYGIENPNEGPFVVMRASRESNNLDIVKSHGFWDIVEADRYGTFSLRSFGKYAAIWPKGVFDTLLAAVSTQRAVIACPDDSQYYSQRQQASYPIALTEEQMQQFKDALRVRLQEAKKEEGNIVFQFAGDNCARELITLLQHVDGLEVPNLFRSSVASAESGNRYLNRIFTWVKRPDGSIRFWWLKTVKVVFMTLGMIFGTAPVTVRVIDEEGNRIRRSLPLGDPNLDHPSELAEKAFRGEEIDGRPIHVTLGHNYALQTGIF